MMFSRRSRPLVCPYFSFPALTTLEVKSTSALQDHCTFLLRLPQGGQSQHESFLSDFRSQLEAAECPTTLSPYHAPARTPPAQHGTGHDTSSGCHSGAARDARIPRSQV